MNATLKRAPCVIEINCIHTSTECKYNKTSLNFIMDTLERGKKNFFFFPGPKTGCTHRDNDEEEEARDWPYDNRDTRKVTDLQ